MRRHILTTFSTSQPKAYLKYVEDWTACGNDVDGSGSKGYLPESRHVNRDTQNDENN